MDLDFRREGFFHLLQQFRRIHWGAELQTMTQAEFMAVSAIRRGHESQPDKPGVYVSSLAEDLMVSVSMVSKMLRTLEEKGWILRTVDPKSRRNTFVSLTDEGRALHDQEQERNALVNQRVLEKMGQARMARLLSDAEMLAKCYAEELGSR